MPDARVDWPVQFSAASYGLRIQYNGFAQQTVTIPVTVGRNYWLSGDGQVDSSTGAGDLLRVLELALETYSLTALSATVTLDSNFRVRIVTPSNLTILWADAATTIDPAIFGFAAATAGPATTLTGANLPHGIWRPSRPLGMDSRDRQPIVGGVLMAQSGLIEVSRVALPYKTRDLSFAFIEPARTLTEYVAATEPTGAFENLWVTAATANRPLRVYADETSRSSSGYTQYKTRSVDDPISRSGPNQYWFDVSLKLQRDS